MADAIAAGRDIRDFDAARLIEDVIARAQEKVWKPLGGEAKLERLLALATICGGLPVERVASLPPALAVTWDIDRHPRLFAEMTGQPAGETIPALSPDIVGKHFVARRLDDTVLSRVGAR